MKQIAKVVGKHIPNCYAIQHEKNGTWDSCWGPVPWRPEQGKAFVTTERRYGKTGRRFTTWLRFICNCCECKAELHVATDAISLWANKQANP